MHIYVACTSHLLNAARMTSGLWRTHSAAKFNPCQPGAAFTRAYRKPPEEKRIEREYMPVRRAYLSNYNRITDERTCEECIREMRLSVCTTLTFIRKAELAWSSGAANCNAASFCFRAVATTFLSLRISSEACWSASPRCFTAANTTDRKPATLIMIVVFGRGSKF